jgi:hypothetical protein
MNLPALCTACKFDRRSPTHLDACLPVGAERLPCVSPMRSTCNKLLIIFLDWLIILLMIVTEYCVVQFYLRRHHPERSRRARLFRCQPP